MVAVSVLFVTRIAVIRATAPMLLVTRCDRRRRRPGRGGLGIGARQLTLALGLSARDLCDLALGRGLFRNLSLHREATDRKSLAHKDVLAERVQVVQRDRVDPHVL